MKTDEEFKAFCENVLLKYINELEKGRKQTKKRLAVFYPFLTLICIISIFAIINMFQHYPPRIAARMSGYLIGADIILAFVAQDIKRRYRLSFKKNVVQGILEFYDNKLAYSPEKGIMYEAYAISNLFSKAAGFKTRDYMEGKIGKAFVQLSVLDLSKGMTGGENSFNGLFMITGFSNPPKGIVLVYYGNHSPLYVDLPFKDTMKLEPMKYGEDSFKEKFTVFASSPDEIPFVLTPSLMNRMVQLQKEVNDKICFSFNRSRMFTAIPGKSNMFEPSINTEIKEEDLLAWSKCLRFTLNVIEEFQMNKT